MQKNKINFIFVNAFLFILLTTQTIYSKDNYDSRYLIDAIKRNNYKDVAKYANTENVNVVDKDWKSPLSYAIEKQNLNIIEVLLNNGADPKIIDIKSKKPLYCSKKIENNQNIAKLFKNMIKPNVEVNIQYLTQK